jgi:hypothetical protein
MTSTGEALVAQLKARGVETVFGIPGVHTEELYRGLANSGIHHVTLRTNRERVLWPMAMRGCPENRESPLSSPVPA